MKCVSPECIDMQLPLCCVMTRLSEVSLEGCPKTASPLPCGRIGLFPCFWRGFDGLLLPQEWSAAQRRVPLNIYWDHTTACMFEKTFFIYSDVWCTSDRLGLTRVAWIKEQSERTFYRTFWRCELKALGDKTQTNVQHCARTVPSPPRGFKPRLIRKVFTLHDVTPISCNTHGHER